MSIKILSQGKRVHRVEYSRVFALIVDGEPSGGGYAFDSDEHGNVNVDALTDIQRQSWENAHTNSYVDEGVRESSWSYWQAAIGLCSCGREVELADPLENECNCGKLYNSCGQEVRRLTRDEILEEFPLEDEY